MAPTVVRPQPLSSANCWCVNGCLAVRAPISEDYQRKRVTERLRELEVVTLLVTLCVESRHAS